MRTQRPYDLGLLCDLDGAEHCDGDEPQQRDWSKQGSHGSRAETLDGEESDENRDGQRYHEGTETRRGDLETLDRAEDRHGRRDHGGAEEQRGAEGGDEQEERTPTPIFDAALLLQHQREERHHASLALVVGA